jgi:hypothetical protein
MGGSLIKDGDSPRKMKEKKSRSFSTRPFSSCEDLSRKRKGLKRKKNDSNEKTKESSKSSKSQDASKTYLVVWNTIPFSISEDFPLHY